MKHYLHTAFKQGISWRFTFHVSRGGMLFHGVSRPETLMKPLKRFMKQFRETVG